MLHYILQDDVRIVSCGTFCYSADNVDCYQDYLSYTLDTPHVFGNVLWSGLFSLVRSETLDKHEISTMVRVLHVFVHY